MSWRFRVGDYYYDRENRTIVHTRIAKVYDVAPVSIPANDNTDINARSMEQARQDFVEKALSDLRIQKRRAEIIERIKSNYGN
jgi:phage head maturation protease